MRRDGLAGARSNEWRPWPGEKFRENLGEGEGGEYSHNTFTMSGLFGYIGDNTVNTRNIRFVNYFCTYIYFVVHSRTVAKRFKFLDLTSAGAMDEGARR